MPDQSLDSAPLTSAQLQMWLLDRLVPGNPAYGVAHAYRLGGHLDVRILEECFSEIIRRHEPLRTTFSENGQGPRQLIHPELRIKIDTTDLRDLAAKERERVLHSVAKAEATTPFDLSRLPLVRVRLFRLDTAEHVLLVNLHHIVVDGMSVSLMLDELDAFYKVLSGSGSARELPPDLSVAHSDFAAEQQRDLSRKAFAGHIDFWRRRLGGRLPVLELPADFPRPRVQSFRGSNVFFHIPRPIAESLGQVGAREGATSFATFLAAFEVFLHRYSGADDILIGTPLTLRTSRGAERLIGNFLNVVPLRCDLGGDPTFLQILRRTRGATHHAFARADLPFERLVESLTLHREPSRNSIFQTLFEVLPAVRSQIGDLSLEGFYFDLGFSQFDLSLHMAEDSGGYACRFEYCTDLFEAPTVERMSRNFLELLPALVRNPDRPVSTIPILTDEEHGLVVSRWNETSRDYPEGECLHQLFEEAARNSPNRTAIEYGGRSLTYAELNERANRLANYLIGHGVRQEELVGVFLERSLDMVVALLGILKAGAAYVPLDPLFPPGRLTYMMEDAGVSVLVTTTDRAKPLPGSDRRRVCLDAERASIERKSPGDPGLETPASNLAYVIYTSGSSGKPKGVMIEHRSVVNFLTAMQERPGFSRDDVLVAVTTISFDIAVLELFLPLVSGGKVVLAGNDECADGSLLSNLLERSGATMLQATPSTWKLLIDGKWDGTPGLQMLCGGEALSRELANQLLERGAGLWNMYGPTETTIWSSVLKVASGEGPVPIGGPIANTRFYIVDRHFRPQPIGVAGELLIGGEGLSRGYLGRPDLTGERFIDQIPVDSSGRVYRTGDLARFRSDGTIEFLGRLDFQVKVRGYRIELEEIEHVLAGHPRVRDVVAVALEDGEDKTLVAYYIPNPGQKPEAAELRTFVRRKLPAYMCPSFFIPMEAFPFTPNGKVDRTAFPKTAPADGQARPHQDAPKRQIETQLAAIWAEALRRKTVGIDENFFDLGGHSLLAARMFARIEEKLGMKLPLAVLFQSPTIRQLADEIERGGWTSSWRSLVPIQPRGSKPPFFLVHGAEGNVLLYRGLARELGEDQPVYGLQSGGLDGHEPLPSRIEDMAAAYVEEIRTVQPEGPYHLGGYCLGGTIALEAARQLQRAGDSVALVALIETYNIHASVPMSFPLRMAHRLQNLEFHLRNLLLSISEGSLGFLVEKFRVEFSRLRLNCQLAYAHMLQTFGWGFGRTYPHLKVKAVNDEAQRIYDPGTYDGRILVFRTRRHYRGLDDPDFGWKSVAKQGVEIVELPHYPRGSLNEPFVQSLGRELRSQIARKPLADVSYPAVRTAEAVTR